MLQFLARVILVTPESLKEDEAALQQGYGLQVLASALQLWPHVSGQHGGARVRALL